MNAADEHFRIVMMSDYFGGDTAATAGAGKSATRIMCSLSKAGLLSHAIGCFGEPPPTRVGVRSIFLDSGDLREQVARAPLKHVQALWNWETRSQIEDVLRELDPARHIVCLHQWTRALTPSCVNTLRRFRQIVYVHDYFWTCPNGAYFNFQTGVPCTLHPGALTCALTSCDRNGYHHKVYRLARHYIKSLSSECDPHNRIFIHISSQSRAVMGRYLPQHRHYVLHHSLEAEMQKPVYRLGEETYDVGYFGRLEPEKGVIQLAQGAARQGLKMLFVGSGSLEGTLASIPNVTLLGWAGPEEVRTLMRSCRAVCLPSLWPETWGLVVPESLSAGVPVIVSCRAGSAELVQRFGGGIIFDHDRAGDIDKALGALMDDTVQRRLSLEAEAVADLAGLRAEHFADNFRAIITEAWG